MSKETECIKKMLEDHGISHTYQREEILSQFFAEPKHYRPNEIFKLLRDKGIGIATVYRTLEMLRECGIIKEISVGREIFYELKESESRYIYVHFLCDKCGKFHDYLDVMTIKKYSDAFDSLESKTDVMVRDVNIIVKGFCSECKE